MLISVSFAGRKLLIGQMLAYSTLQSADPWLAEGNIGQEEAGEIALPLPHQAKIVFFEYLTNDIFFWLSIAYFD
ncbi:hypothetical protein [Thiobacillus thioparus]|uniref:hypothetical protein n=1 Tax=Thiobacillus thioparus TaxID=931 RepID=UPI0012F8714B|nr:hypothetical protein [Thiobacillus thioparus]